MIDGLNNSDSVFVKEKFVTSGWFKARSTIVKSFKKSLDTNRAVQYLTTITSKSNHFSIPFYNDFLIEVCRRRKDLIQTQVIDKFDKILRQNDSIKIFFSRFLEAEHLVNECESLLKTVQDKESFEYLNLNANLHSHYGARHFDDSLQLYQEALSATDIEQYQAQIYNNMAHLIYRHRRRRDYKQAIEYCKSSIKQRSTVKFWYPSVLMLILKVELSNIGEIENCITNHKTNYGLKDFEFKEFLKRLHDKEKEKYIRENLK